MVQIFCLENKKNRHTTKYVLQFLTDILVILLWLTYTYKYAFIKPKTIFEHANFFSVQRFSVLEKTTYENILFLCSILIIYIWNSFILASTWKSTSLFCVFHRYIFIKLCKSKVNIKMNPYCCHVRISSIFCRQMTRYPQKIIMTAFVDWFFYLQFERRKTNPPFTEVVRCWTDYFFLKHGSL